MKIQESDLSKYEDIWSISEMKMHQYKSETTRLLILQSFPLFKNKILTPAIVE
jgi:hypothetical protein